MSDVKFGEILGPGGRGAPRKAGQQPVLGDVPAGRRGRFRFPRTWSPPIIARSTPPRRRVRAILLAALAYFVLPFDAVPDILAGVGFADDVTILLAAISAVGAHIAPRHREPRPRLRSMTPTPAPAA